ncbi:acyl-coenzyme A diphosphatase NUDT19-like isoform X1 [Hydractinia symbiolongicarpus]|uniref:acyl-coenzyme A diphosphatase NUDT19-like isoform X1 n=1 Tax=Hydractinia symbiolongicarpus TaxID=13093 RepID=UPI0025500881|nr:acyl-coenzyme A diphosphatase NUDT19-like isoform X1 [Hydractinia symbiolongicarpus]XP_057290449.1 acyl-coenzyme A diphosphatase NUDT19-like isoform X1 [Hydractinia symbiolongicarpus]XP_057290450.1 acyl-coenzyme A diphosphatase NUDT19-like isoform X1 [Hydractinia symbiolongicarpus]
MNKLNATKQWRDAATLMLVARSGAKRNGYKILMLKRSAKSKFMPNAYVFPGGVTSLTTDFTEEWNDIFKRNNYSNKFSRLLNTTKPQPSAYTSNISPGRIPPELAFRICAIRETFEESGILLLTDYNGKEIVLDDPTHNLGGEFGTLQSWRDKINEDDNNFLKLFRSLKSSPSIHQLFDWSTWLTPNFVSRRFDTMFYTCFVDEIPNHGRDCGEEVTETVWLSPFDVWDNSYNFKPPQIHEMLRLSRYKTFDELKKFTIQREASGLNTWCAFKKTLKDGFVWTYPGDDFHNADPVAESDTMNVTINELREMSRNTNRIELVTDDTSGAVVLNNIDWFGHPSLDKHVFASGLLK